MRGPARASRSRAATVHGPPRSCAKPRSLRGPGSPSSPARCSSQTGWRRALRRIAERTPWHRGRMSSTPGSGLVGLIRFSGQVGCCPARCVGRDCSRSQRSRRWSGFAKRKAMTVSEAEPSSPWPTSDARGGARSVRTFDSGVPEASPVSSSSFLSQLRRSFSSSPAREMRIQQFWCSRGRPRVSLELGRAHVADR